MSRKYTETKIERHIDTPTVDLEQTLTRIIVAEAGHEIEKGRAYLIYDCGCVWRDDEDPNYREYFSGTQSRQRQCIIHHKRLINKYKLCGCGKEHTGLRVKSAVCCGYCDALRKTTQGASDVPVRSKYENGHLVDPERCFCIYRDACIETYIEYETIPCKNCERYCVRELY